MTSQRWLTDADVDRSVWWHWQAIIVPDNLHPEFAKNALLYMTGGSNGGSPAKKDNADLVMGAILAQTTQTLVSVLFQVPNSPIHFAEEKPEPKRRSEDAILAWAWQHFIEHPDQPEWLPRLPMTKAGMRAMDALSEFWQQETGLEVTDWIVSGASKRGWTAWTLAICDQKRVKGVIPLVLDIFPFVESVHRIWRNYGGWSFALKDYVDLNITTHLDNPIFAKAMEIVDPTNYPESLRMPKLVISAAGDEFLLPDDVDGYWPLLKGEKHFHTLPNGEHALVTVLPQVLEAIHGFVMGVQSNTPRPVYEWRKEKDGSLVVTVDARSPPSSVKLWWANTIDGNRRRDFRLVTLSEETGQPWIHPVWWNSTDLAPTRTTESQLEYSALVDPPAEGWVGFTIELVWPLGLSAQFNASNFRVTSGISILPDTYPFEDCVAEACWGPLV